MRRRGYLHENRSDRAELIGQKNLSGILLALLRALQKWPDAADHDSKFGLRFDMLKLPGPSANMTTTCCVSSKLVEGVAD
jgi:hypothetical protein